MGGALIRGGALVRDNTVFHIELVILKEIIYFFSIARILFFFKYSAKNSRIDFLVCYRGGTGRGTGTRSTGTRGGITGGTENDEKHLS